MDDLIRSTPDRERAKSLLGMVEVRLDAINVLKRQGAEKYSSKIIEEYYESVLELITALMSAEGFKTRSDITGAHIASINFLRRYDELGEHEIHLIDELRRKRAGIKYYGRKVPADYLERKERDIIRIVGILKSVLETKA